MKPCLGDAERHRALGCGCSRTGGDCRDVDGGDMHRAGFCTSCRITMLGDECLEGTVSSARGDNERCCGGDALRADFAPVDPVAHEENGITDGSMLRIWVIGVVGFEKLTLLEGTLLGGDNVRMVSF